MRRLTSIIAIICLSNGLTQGQTPPGMWKAQIPYSNVYKLFVLPDNTILAQTDLAFFIYDPNYDEFTLHNRTTGLSDHGISTSAFHYYTGKYVIAYKNGNIDIFSPKNVINVPYLKNATTFPQKTIYNIYTANDTNLAYLSSDAGIIVLDVEEGLIREMWDLSGGSSLPRVLDLIKMDSLWFAVSTSHILFCPDSKEPSFYGSWDTLLSLSSFDFVKLIELNGNLLVVGKDSIISAFPDTQTLFIPPQGHIGSVLASTDSGIIVTVYTSESYPEIYLVKGSGYKLLEVSRLPHPEQIVALNGELWYADSWSGLYVLRNGELQRKTPSGPASAYISKTAISRDGTVLWAVDGTRDQRLASRLYRPGRFMKYDYGEWENIESYRIPELENFLDIISLAIDPNSGNIFAGSLGNGLLQITPDGQVIAKYDTTNSELKPHLTSPGDLFITGLAFDSKGNLWIANALSSRPIAVLTNDGRWFSFSIPIPVPSSKFIDLIIDKYDNKWFIIGDGGGILVYHEGESIEDPSDDKYKLLGKGSGNGNLHSTSVFALAVDRKGYVWVGTNDGITVFYCADRIWTDEGCDAERPVVETPTGPAWVLQGEQIFSIAVDSGDYKWIGTANGLWHLSPQTTETIDHFNTDNSPLFSNSVLHVNVIPLTGEVFVATDQGSMTYGSEGADFMDKCPRGIVYPQPVPPDYDGPVAIRNIPVNAHVKITTPEGILIYEGIARGGSFFWNLQDLYGREVPSGTYLAIATGEEENGRRVTCTRKVVVVR